MAFPDSPPIASGLLECRFASGAIGTQFIASWMHQRAALFMQRIASETFNPKRRGSKHIGRGGKIRWTLASSDKEN